MTSSLANVLLTSDGRAKIADFGVARLADAQVTATGQLLGTPAFMAPEQFVGGQIDGRADLFAAGVVIYWMVTGDKPFAGDSILAVQYKVVHTDPVPPRKLNPAVPLGLETVILKSLAKDPAQRYQSGMDLANDLRTVRTGRTHIAARTVLSPEDETLMGAAPLPTPKPAPEQPRDDSRGKTVRLAIVAVIVIASLISSGRFANILKQRKQPKTTVVAPPQSNIPQPTIPPQPPAEKKAAQVPARKETPVPEPKSKAEVTAAGLSLELTARERAGVVFRTEGQPTQSLTMQPGDSITLRAQKEATLTVSNAGALDAKLNGKPLSFGTEKQGGMFVITPDGIDEARSSASWLHRPPDQRRNGFSPESAAGGKAASRGNKNIGTTSRQIQLAQSPTAVRLLIKSPPMGELMTLIVTVDNEPLFRHEPVLPGQRGPRRGPLEEERFIPSGQHKIQVSVLVAETPLGPPQELTEMFLAQQRRTLSIQFSRDTQRGTLPTSFSITLQ